MVRQKAKPKAPLGRPSLSGKVAPGDRSPMVAIRLPPNELAAIDALADREGVKRSEMIRRLLEAGKRALKRS